ncbi:argininosuccinate lyase [Tenacibaculum maritimum]|uniref:argininosuccinate lyase n=1 Tax=Tenacibaculum maritimum TaxID=107401 RepID=UPI0010A3DD4A|nr:argininosuccinate lyase [Tenacibaculum maritimum]MCD9563156.1 argininosuccinate lyase [Tenacibaculum maritimum]MCD9566473.1 argininosuccinate lyase [Tenacibaculum maritimum]MCD9579794.1 argininosuccinate lyase [Tenacibaculum maritimum]MCD9597248.1 argininosuccinate lyase [Tenacibaculum maritimum]MCD9614364.1 argininosuccinate lyase [Tenacibaculum maritimum]
MKLWDKGLTIDQKIEQFTVGNDREVDLYIAKYDVQASLAHAKMLHEVNILSRKELTMLETGLKKLAIQIKEGTFVIEPMFEDVHSKIEFELTKEFGEVGKKIHTARSRNDQVLVALQLYYKESLLEIKKEVNILFNTLLLIAEKYKNNLIPGYTHLQVAMPSSIGLWVSAYAELLIDDVSMLNAAIKIIDQNPLGSAAGYGSSFPIDRNFTTRCLQFETLKYNVIAAQLSRGKNERFITGVLGGICNTLSRFAMDICLYNSQNFNFISFPEELTTGSSIMPHKKNPDVFELIRGKCNKIQALQTEILLVTNNLPSGYHRDFQLLKENMILAVAEVKSILTIFTYAIQQMIIKEVDLNEEKYQHLFTVDSINNLVMEGMPFREAYQKIGKEVKNNTYEPNTNKKHTHIGSVHNLCLDKIKIKMKGVL